MCSLKKCFWSPGRPPGVNDHAPHRESGQEISAQRQHNQTKGDRLRLVLWPFFSRMMHLSSSVSERCDRKGASTKRVSSVSCDALTVPQPRFVSHAWTLWVETKRSFIFISCKGWHAIVRVHLGINWELCIEKKTQIDSMRLLEKSKSHSYVREYDGKDAEPPLYSGSPHVLFISAPSAEHEPLPST